MLKNNALWRDNFQSQKNVKIHVCLFLESDILVQRFDFDGGNKALIQKHTKANSLFTCFSFFFQ